MSAATSPSPRSIFVRRGVIVAVLTLAGACSKPALKEPAPAESAAFKRVRQVFARIPDTLAKNHKRFDGPAGPVTGFGAGDAYPQIWLRDSAWIVDAAAAYYPPDTLTSWLDLHLANAEPNGRLRDWVARGSADAFRQWAPRVQGKGDYAFDTNSNESDQEPSAAIAFCRGEEITGSRLDARPARAERLRKVVGAMKALLRDRTDAKSGLVWSGLTADWGDVSPVYPDQRAIYFDDKTPRTLSLYSNVMVFGALHCLASKSESEAERGQLAARAVALRERIRAAFWMKERGYFRMRAPLDRLPLAFASDDDRFALGGNALAALFGVADDEQAKALFGTAERLRAAHDFSTISTVLIPPYAEGVFQHDVMRRPFHYQNGGQWDWFGAALVRAEFERGFSASARTHLNQIVSRILRAGEGIHEWYGGDGVSQGSAAYAAAGASIHDAIVKGLFGITRASDGYRAVVRSGETFLPFDVPMRATNETLSIRQSVGETTLDVQIAGSARVVELCSVLPEGARPDEPPAADGSLRRSSRKVGSDTLVCVDTSTASPPIKVRFTFRR